MNQRIREFAEQARLHAKEIYPGVKDIKAWGQVYHEKFAELIVAECADFLKDTLDDHFAAEQLEEHFGVEE